MAPRARCTAVTLPPAPVNFITQKPTGEFGGKFTGELGSDSLWGVKGTVYTGTLGSVGEGLGALSGSFGAMTRQRDELYDNTNPNLDDFDDLDRKAYRIALRWEVNDQLDSRLRLRSFRTQ